MPHSVLWGSTARTTCTVIAASDYCQQHWNPVCIVCKFLVEVTPENNAYCRLWSGFEGKKLLRSCHTTADNNCSDCRTGHIWTNSHGEACHTGCVFGLVMNHCTQVCETCTQRCQSGYRFPLAVKHHNCTHCVTCERLGVQLQKLAVWDFVEDWINCVLTCPVGSATSTQTHAGSQGACCIREFAPRASSCPLMCNTGSTRRRTSSCRAGSDAGVTCKVRYNILLKDNRPAPHQKITTCANGRAHTQGRVPASSD